MRLTVILACLALAPAARAAQGAPQGPVVAELFTSQGCSSCPPADALLAELRRTRPDVLALDMHVTYWNRLGWTDPYSLPAATARQRAYDQALGVQVYTPQLVVGGAQAVVGSDPAAVAAALEEAARAPAGPALRVGWDGQQVGITVGPGRGHGSLVLVGFDAMHRTRVGSGENGGAELTEVNVVRSLRPVGTWDGAALTLDVPPPEGERGAVLLQGADGAILAAAVLPGG